MIIDLLFSILAIFFILDMLILLISLTFLIIRDIIDDIRKWYKRDDWGYDFRNIIFYVCMCFYIRSNYVFIIDNFINNKNLFFRK